LRKVKELKPDGQSVVTVRWHWTFKALLPEFLVKIINKPSSEDQKAAYEKKFRQANPI